MEEAVKSATRLYGFCSDLTAALITACSAARLATSLGIVPRATVEVEQAATVVVGTEVVDTEVEATAEEVMVEAEAVEVVEEEEVCFLLSSMGSSTVCVCWILIPHLI